MTYREIRDHKFKILFSYYALNTEIDEVLLNYFDGYPYEDEDDENSYIEKKDSFKTIHKVSIDTKDSINVSDPIIEISITERENICDIKQKIKDIVNKTSDIDNLIKECLITWDINRVAKAELTIIRLAVYEMYFDSSIDLAVAVNEAVELAKVYGDDKADKFVNGVLATIYKKKCEKQ